jgi:hypothetical protein
VYVKTLMNGEVLDVDIGKETIKVTLDGTKSVCE